MLKPEKTSLEKGRWLVLDQTNHTKEEVLARIRAIDGAEIQIVDTKTYVRFPERRTNTVKPLFADATMLRQKRTGFIIKDAEIDSPRQYCAVMLKNGK